MGLPCVNCLLRTQTFAIGEVPTPRERAVIETVAQGDVNDPSESDDGRSCGPVESAPKVKGHV